MTPAQRGNIRRLIARRTWPALADRYRVTTRTLIKGVSEGRRPHAMTPDQWEDVLVYRHEREKAIKLLESCNVD